MVRTNIGSMFHIWWTDAAADANYKLTDGSPRPMCGEFPTGDPDSRLYAVPGHTDEFDSLREFLNSPETCPECRRLWWAGTRVPAAWFGDEADWLDDEPVAYDRS